MKSRHDVPRSREALRNQYDAVFEHASDAIFVIDLETDLIVDCNPAAETLVGYSCQDLTSMTASELHSQNLPKFREFVDEVRETGRGRTDEIPCYCESGEIVPTEISATLVELDGRPHLVNHVRQRTTREDREWFEALLEHSSDLITVVHPDGTVRYQSVSVDHVMGYDPDELRDRSLYDFVHPDDVETLREAFDWLDDQSGSVVRRVEYRFRHADGSWAWLESIISYRPDTPITGYVLNSRDITSRKESQQQAAVLNRVLRHNLRNGLNVILGRAESLTDADRDAVASDAEAIVSKAWELYDATSYTKDLTEILESTEVSQECHDVTTLVEDAVSGLSGADVEFDLDLPAEQRVMAAPKLDVALDHVLQNAVEHNDAESPKVGVTVETPASEAGYVEVTVEDNGPGIPQQEREVLLEGDETQLRHGSGLGLWIVNWIVTRSGGRIAFDESVPRGSRVTIALPPAT